MENKKEIPLTEEQIDRICENLRVIDFLSRNQEKIEINPEMKKQMKLFREKVKEIMDILTDEQRDKVLETHKTQTETVRKELAKRQKSRK
jgi:hypothetical protein